MIAKLAVVAQERKPTKQRNSTLKFKSLFTSFSISTSSPSFPSRVLLTLEILYPPNCCRRRRPSLLLCLGSLTWQEHGCWVHAKYRCDNSQPCPGLCNQALRYELQSVGYSLLPANVSKYIFLWHSSVITEVSCSPARRNSFKTNTILHKS